jgi:hypothetical protein
MSLRRRGYLVEWDKGREEMVLTVEEFARVLWPRSKPEDVNLPMPGQPRPRKVPMDAKVHVIDTRVFDKEGGWIADRLTCPGRISRECGIIGRRDAEKLYKYAASRRR